MGNIDKSKLTFAGSMNYLLQARRTEGGFVSIDNYMPRKNSIWSGEVEEKDAIYRMQETMERMKIAINLMQDFIDRKTDYVYYWELNNEDCKLS